MHPGQGWGASKPDCTTIPPGDASPGKGCPSQVTQPGPTGPALVPWEDQIFLPQDREAPCQPKPEMDLELYLQSSPPPTPPPSSPSGGGGAKLPRPQPWHPQLPPKFSASSHSSHQGPRQKASCPRVEFPGGHGSETAWPRHARRKAWLSIPELTLPLGATLPWEAAFEWASGAPHRPRIQDPICFHFFMHPDAFSSGRRQRFISRCISCCYRCMGTTAGFKLEEERGERPPQCILGVLGFSGCLH